MAGLHPPPLVSETHGNPANTTPALKSTTLGHKEAGPLLASPNRLTSDDYYR